MSNRFFSLIDNKKKVSTNKRIIPSAEVAHLMDAAEILKAACEDAEKYKLKVAEECEELKKLAEQEGFAAGYANWATYVVALENEIAKVHQELTNSVIPVAIKAAKKILGKEIDLSDDTIVDIVSNILKSVAQHKKITIYANKKDINSLERNRPRIKEIFESLEALSIRERTDIARGGCVIETEGGIINAQIENQWSALERAFATLNKRSGKESQTSNPSENK